MIKLIDIRKVFNTGKPNEFDAVRGINLTIEANKTTVLKGPSGSGKTTLLSLIGCMARPTSGRIWIKESEVTSLPEKFLTEMRRNRFGFIFQQYNLIKGITALENAMLPAFPAGEKFAAIRKRGLALFELFNIASKAHMKVEWLSGGEAQRVTIARALINRPEIIIADEPTAHLDSKLSLELMNILTGLKAEGKTVILASHDPLVCDSTGVDRVVNLRDGRIEELGQ